jgi:hypothetical protein
MLFFIPVLGLLGLGIVVIRRATRMPVDGRSEDVAGRLLRWAVGLLAAERVEWGQAMLGELGHLDGRVRRLRFALGCAGAALVLPPWGRAAAGAWALIALAVGGVGLNVGLAARYRLAGGDWIAAGVLTVVMIGFLLGAGALLRRPGVAMPGLAGGLLVALVSLTVSGFTVLDQLLPNIVPWHRLLEYVVVPLAVGAGGTLYSGDPITGKRIARLAAVAGGLGLYVYRTTAVAVIGGGGPYDQDGGGTLRGTVGDRLGNNLFLLLVIVTVTATVGWGAAAATGALAAARTRPATTVPLEPATAAAAVNDASRAPASEPGHKARPAGVRPIGVRRWRLAVYLLLLGALVAAVVLLAAASGLRG